MLWHASLALWAVLAYTPLIAVVLRSPKPGLGGGINGIGSSEVGADFSPKEPVKPLSPKEEQARFILPPGYSFTLDVESHRLLGLLRDGGPPLPEVERVMPDTDSENGRGLALARVALDDLEYERVDDHNEWTMVRRRR